LDETGGIVKTEQVESASVIRLGGKDVLYIRKPDKCDVKDRIIELKDFISMTYITGYHVAVAAKAFVDNPGNWLDLVAVARQKHMIAWTEE